MKYKISKYFTLCLFIFLNFTFYDKSKSAYRVMGTGNQDCKIITLHSNVEEVRTLTITWVQGFLTGLNLAMSNQYHTIGNNISENKIWEELLNYCESNPQYSLTKVSESIFMKLNKQSD